MIGADVVPVAGGESIYAPQGVFVHVEISPLDCVGACSHGPIAVAGAEMGALAWVAFVLLAVGAALVARWVSAGRRVRRSGAD